MKDENKTLKLGNFLSQLADKSEHVYWLSSGDFETIEYINPAYEIIWGRKVDELYKNPEKWISFLHPDDAKNHHPIIAMKERIQKLGASARYREDYRIIRPDGTVRWIMDRGFPIYDDEGICCGVTGVALDVTKEKEAELALQNAKNAAEAANRAKTEFLANMSHDVKSPMSGIVMYSDLMMTQDSWLTKKNAEQIHSSAEQVLNFFNSCLELSKLEKSELESEKESFSLPVLVNDIYALFVPRAYAKKLSFTINYESTVPSLFMGYRGTLYRVILNLVGNAVKFTETGHVRVRVFIANPASNNNIMIGIEVSDTGPGIPEDKHQVIFEKLERLTPSYHGKVEGSGIGLYIVDKYLKHMSANIKLESEVGKGSTFTVFVPFEITDEWTLSDEERQKHHSSAKLVAPVESPAARPKQFSVEKVVTLADDAPLVLLVEDSLLIQIPTESLLNSAGFRVDIASDGKEALEKFEPNKYVYVYMDMGLPDKQGHEVAALMREKKRTLKTTTITPIVALTAHAAVEVESFCKGSGMQGVLSKPITREKIDAMWKRYGQGKNISVPGMMLLDESVTICTVYKKAEKNELAIIDIDGTMALLHSETEVHALFEALSAQLKDHYLPHFEIFVQKKNYNELRKEIHSLIGDLSYSKAPRLNEAVLNFQTAAREMSESVIDETYARVKVEADSFIADWRTFNA